MDTLKIAASDSVVYLSHRFVIPETIELNVTDSISLDPLTGAITLHSTRTDSAFFIVKYQYLPLNLPLNRIVNLPPRIYTGNETAEPSSTDYPAHPPAQYSTETTDFLKSGTLYRGVTLGSQSGMSLQSGLNLELQGKIAEDISIVGTITDQNIPIEPEGNTQTLDEIDKVFITVVLPHERLTFGDYEMAYSSGSLGNYNRKLQGVYLESERPPMRNVMSGAVSKGQYYHNYFLGEESNQGPYQLIGRNGETDIIVLAGTEKVWLDGRLLTRGESNDYIIDYSTAEITFMTRQIITAESRISVDFQYSDLIYQKNIYMAGNTTNLFDEKLRVSAAAITEKDDRENPIELVLSGADKKLLKSLGDNAQDAYISTITSDTNGSYILVDSILIYAGPGQGTHTATFYNVGKAGSYKKVYRGEVTYFEWVDKNNPLTAASEIASALYLPVKPLKLPTSRTLYHLASDWRPHQNFAIKAEVARSDFDQNLFSPLNDEDNAGLAVDLTSNLIIPLSESSKIALAGHYKQENWGFEPIDRHQIVEYRRKWDLPSDSTNGEQYYEGQIQYALKNNLVVKTEGGQYSRGDFNSNRFAASAGLSYKMLENVQISEEFIQRNQTGFNDINWTRRGFRLITHLWKVKPFATLNYELREGDTIRTENFRFLEQIYGIGSASPGRLTWQVQTTLRRDDLSDSNTWIKGTNARNIGLNGQLINWHSFSSQWNYIYRIKKFYNQNNLDIVVHLLDFSLKQEPRKLPYRWETTLKIENEQTVKKEWRYYYVGDGMGDYIYDSTYADYVPDPQGDYILRILPSSIKVPITSIEDGLRFQFDGANVKMPIFGDWLKRISTLTDVRLRQEIHDPQGIIKYLATDINQVDTSWANYSRIIQQDVNLRSRERKSDLRLRFYSSDLITQADVRGLEKTFTNEWSLRYRNRYLGKTTIESESALKNYSRQSEINSLRGRDIYTVREKLTMSTFLDRIHLIGTEITLNSDKAKGSDPIESLLTGVKLSYERKIVGKGRWKSFVELDKVSVTPKGKAIPYEMSNGKKEGLTGGWGTTVEYRVGSNVSIRVNYEGWKEPQRSVYHLGSGEVRLSF
ncbi:MAG: hypothetical protein GX870_02715 [Candidatus Marinimicrobia bacterium]|nr:hypothetical protein [Candidatus Neomarinimicrobiota bacterium]